MISYSFHLSNKKHALTTTKKVTSASKHNLRQYQSDEYCKENIIVLVGGDNILDDVKELYHQEFDSALVEYNQGKRSDRRIDDYLQYVSESGKNDVAAEIIIQLGNMEFWSNKTEEQKRSMEKMFRKQLDDLRELVPEFKIASAVIHLDEASPHMHVVGIPVATGYKRGLSKQVAKTKVFTTEVLTMLQEEMHKRVDEEMQQHEELFQNVELKEIERGRNADWSKEYYIQQKQELHQELEQEIKILTDDKERLEEEFVKKVVDSEKKKMFLQYALIDNPKTMVGKVVSGAWKQFQEWWISKRQKNVEEKARISIREKLIEAKAQVDIKNKIKSEEKKIETLIKREERCEYSSI